MTAYIDDVASLPGTEPRLAAVEAELVAREPIFHHPELGTDRRSYESMTAEDFFEIGASGRRYGREHVIGTLVARYADAYREDWRADDFRCRELAPDLYRLTCDLWQEGGTRHTRRSTLWRRATDGWRIVFHQGTVVEPDAR